MAIKNETRNAPRRAGLRRLLASAALVALAGATIGQSERGEQSGYDQMLQMQEEMRELAPFIVPGGGRNGEGVGFFNPEAWARYQELSAAYEQMVLMYDGDQVLAMADRVNAEQILLPNEPLPVAKAPSPQDLLALSGGGPIPPPGCTPSTNTVSGTPELSIQNNLTYSDVIPFASPDTFIYDVNVTTNIEHNYSGDLDVYLISPSGTRVTLTTDNGSFRNDIFDGTTWDDDAGDLNPPGAVTDSDLDDNVVEAYLVPEEALGAFFGEDPNGGWTLEVTDDNNSPGCCDTGYWCCWSIEITTLSSPPVCEAASATDDPEPDIPVGCFETDGFLGPCLHCDQCVRSITFDFPEGAVICDVNLFTDIAHVNPKDLDIHLVSPDGTWVTITTDNGGGNDNVFAGTLWDDDAGDSNAPGPVTDEGYSDNVVESTLVPEEALAAFIGEDPDGTWTLYVRDDHFNLKTGHLRSWTLDIKTCECGDDCNDNGIPDDEDIADGTSQDCNENGIPDECDIDETDPDMDGLVSLDCNENDIPDECDTAPLLWESFDAAPCWTATGLWHTTDACAQPGVCDPPTWMYFGYDETCDFTGDGCATESGVVTFDPFEIPERAGSAHLSFCSIYRGDAGTAPSEADVAWVEANGVIVDDVGADGDQCEWETRWVDLGAFIGETVTLTFHFDSGDEFKNCELGWQIDRVHVSTASGDCNDNGIPDSCDIADDTADDCNTNGVPDSCELPDCNDNGVPDECDIADDTEQDCNANGRPDSCDIADGKSLDCNGNDVPDECEPDGDCNGNGILDECDILGTPVLYSINRDGATLRTLNPHTGETLGSIDLVLPGAVIIGGNGLATHPDTGELWALLRIEGDGTSRRLVRILPTGLVVSVGHTGDKFAAIAFGTNADLCGVTGDGASVPESLFVLSQDDGTATLLCELGNGDDGEALAYVPEVVGGTMYHASGSSDQVFESIDDTTGATCGVTDIPIPDSSCLGAPTALTWWTTQGVFLRAGLDRCEFDRGLYRLTDTGAIHRVGPLDHISKGLAFASIGRDCNENGIPDDCETAPGPIAPLVNGHTDSCEDAMYVTSDLIYTGSNVGATTTNELFACDGNIGLRDVWFLYVPATSGIADASWWFSDFQGVVSVHTDCPATFENRVDCANSPDSDAVWDAVAKQKYYIFIAGQADAAGDYQFQIIGPEGSFNDNDCNNNAIPDECECFADVTGDGTVDQDDFLAVQALVGQNCTCPEDVDGNGVVNDVDLIIVLNSFGDCPFPSDELEATAAVNRVRRAGVAPVAIQGPKGQ